MLDNTCLKKRKEKKKILELRQSTKIPLEITVFHSQTLYELWPWRSKLSFLTLSKALRLWKLFFRTVSILWVDKSQKCCWIEDIDSKLTVFRILKFSTNSDTFWLLILIIIIIIIIIITNPKCWIDYAGLANAGNSFVFRFKEANLAFL